MRNAFLLFVALPASGYQLASSVSGWLGGAVFSHLPGAGAPWILTGRAAEFGGIASLAFFCAGLWAVVSPSVLRMRSSDGWIRALTFAHSLLLSLVMSGLAFVCAAGRVAATASASQGLSHGAQCLLLGVFSAQLISAGSLWLLRDHFAVDAPRGKFSERGYAALSDPH